MKAMDRKKISRTMWNEDRKRVWAKEWIPSIKEMKKCCKLLYKRAKDSYGKSGEASSTSSWGFKVSIDEYRVEVEFILSWYTSYDFTWDY